MRVGIRHLTRLEYTADVVEGVMDVRLGPLSDADQRWERFELRVTPPASVRPYADGFGNRAHLVTVARPHRTIELVTTGEAQTLLADPFRPAAEPPRPLGPSELADFLGPSALVPRDSGAAALAEPLRPARPEDSFEAVRRLTALVYDGFTYRQHVTTVATTVPEVLAARSGVCQDFAHLLLALCRSLGIPARYVSGYIVSGSAPAAQTMGPGGMAQTLGGMTQTLGAAPGPADPAEPVRGGGASHAWIEAWTPTHGWRGFDPTNNLVASEHHVKMAVGRDYHDVPPTRGTFRGHADEALTVDVSVRRLE